jgi:HTH-type transcriptional regulator, sugar sensing transcriptional regulator
MVVNKLITNLTNLGFSEYEAKAYVALTSANPATAYELAKVSGIPTSKVYEVISRLLDKGLILYYNDKDKNRYIPIKYEEFIESRRNKFENILNDVKHDLSKISKESDISYIWNLHDYDNLIEKTKRIIQESSKYILISTWPDELTLFTDSLKQKRNDGINISIIHFGEINVNFGQIFQHPIKDTIYSEKGGRGFVIVSDSNEALMATIHQNNYIEGAWSMNKGFVTLAEDYIKHDIYIMKIVKRFDKLLIKKFGPNYKKLRDIYKDEEEK